MHFKPQNIHRTNMEQCRLHDNVIRNSIEISSKSQAGWAALKLFIPKEIQLHALSFQP